MFDQRTLPNEPKFIDMENIIHLDEKWYNTTKKTGPTIYSRKRRTHTGLCKIKKEHDLLFTPGRGGPYFLTLICGSNL